MDSIDASRNLLRVNTIEGTTAYKDYILRMKSIKHYIAYSRNKIDHLEQMLSTIKKIPLEFTVIINRLRARLGVQNAKIPELEKKVNDCQERNFSLTKATLLQENELSEKEKLINKKNLELINAKEEVQRLMMQNRWIEGNS